MNKNTLSHIHHIIEREKQLLGEYSSQFIKNYSTIAIGTGSTIKFFIHALAKRIKDENLQIRAVASSKQSELLAESLGIRITNANNITDIDVMIDGADQLNLKKELIKGGGGALLREKLLAQQAKQLIIIADHSKVVKKFTFHLPVEIEPFSFKFTIQNVQNLGVKPKLRYNGVLPLTTDNQNYIIDIDYTSFTYDIENLHNRLKQIPGVIETGYFAMKNKRIFIANENCIKELVK